MSDPQDDPDVALMMAFVKGDEEAFVTLYERYRNRMVNFCRRLLGIEAEGEEAAQEVFLKLYRSRDRYQANSKFSTYIFRIATNHCLNLRARHERSRRQDGIDLERQADQNPSPEDQTWAQQTRRAVQEAVATLPERQAAAFILCHYQGLSYHDAAEALEVSEGAIKSLVFRARDNLQQHLKRAMRLDAGIAEAPHAL